MAAPQLQPVAPRCAVHHLSPAGHVQQNRRQRRSIEVDGKPASVARAGDSADVTLTGVDATAVCSGTVLCHPDFPVPLVDK